MWQRIYRFIGRYLAIGVLLGIGFVLVEEMYMRVWGEERLQRYEQMYETLIERTYSPGYKSFFDRMAEERPEALLSFSLARARIVEGGVQVTGTISNAGPGIFLSFHVEVEAFDENGSIVAECDEYMQNLEPGDEETVVMLCPFVEGSSVSSLSEVSFRIKHKLTLEQAVDPDARPYSSPNLAVAAMGASCHRSFSPADVAEFIQGTPDSDVALTARRKDDEIIGYGIYNIQNVKRFLDVGLRNADVLVSVCGIPVTDVFGGDRESFREPSFCCKSESENPSLIFERGSGGKIIRLPFP